MPLQLLSSLTESWRGTVLIVGILAAGLTIGVTLGGWSHVPARLAALEAAQRRSDSLRLVTLAEVQRLADSTAQDLRDAITGVRSQVVGMRQLVVQGKCLQLAQSRRTPWENCLPDLMGKP
jgi:hypothetical protein